MRNLSKWSDRKTPTISLIGSFRGCLAIVANALLRIRRQQEIGCRLCDGGLFFGEIFWQLARPILQEYDASTVDELDVNPAN